MDKITSTDFPELSCEFRKEELTSELEELCGALETPIEKYGIWIKDDTFEVKYADYYPQVGLLIKTDNATDDGTINANSLQTI